MGRLMTEGMPSAGASRRATQAARCFMIGHECGRCSGVSASDNPHNHPLIAEDAQACSRSRAQPVHARRSQLSVPAQHVLPADLSRRTVTGVLLSSVGCASATALASIHATRTSRVAATPTTMQKPIGIPTADAVTGGTAANTSGADGPPTGRIAQASGAQTISTLPMVAHLHVRSEHHPWRSAPSRVDEGAP